MRNPYSSATVLEVTKSVVGLVTSAGETIKPVFSGSYNPDGTIRLTQIDTLDIKKEINSYRSQCDMSIILSKLMAGDTSVLSQRVPMYGDFTSFPKTYADMLTMVQRGAELFDQLPADVRAAFDNDRAKWFAQIGSEKWNNEMGSVFSPPAPSPSPAPVPGPPAAVADN